MTKREVAELLKFLNDSYPSLEVTQSRIDTWHRLFKGQNPAVVMRNAERHVLTQKFPPSIADLREIKTDANNNDFLKQKEEWERDAVGHQPRS